MKVKNLKCVYTNTDNSLCSKLDELKGYLATSPIHIAAISEAKPKNGEIPDKDCLNIDGYNLFLSKSYFDQDTRGVVVYAHQDLNAIQLDIDMCNTFKDCLWLKVPTTTEDFLIGCVYRSGTKEKAQALDDDLNTMIKNMSLNAGYKNVLIVGDFNFPDISWNPEPVITTNHRNANHPEHKFVDTINDAMLHQHIHRPTRDRNGQASKIDDLIFTSDPDIVFNIEHTGHLGSSDHQILEFETSSMFQEKTLKPQIRFKYHQTDFDAFKNHMNQDWDSIMMNKSAEECYNTFLDYYNEACRLFIPTERIFRNNRYNKPIWMKPSTLNLIKRKRRCHIKFLNTRSPIDKLAYNTIRNEVTASTRRDRLAFERNISKEIKNNNKLFWRYVNSQRKSKANIPDLERPDGSMATSDEEKAEILNNQFASVFTQEDLINIPDFDPHPFSSTLSTVLIQPQTVKKKLSKLRTDKSCGLDGVHPLLLNKLSDIMSIPLAKIYNTSLTTGKVPQAWKEGVVTAIYKNKGRRSCAANYRAITLTSIVCKVLEKIIVELVEDHLKRNNLKTSKQHGFTPKKSTTTNLIEALNIWSEALSHGLPVDIIYLDYEKAFDKVPHHRLILQLSKFGITGNILSWIQDYLHNRTQKVRVNGSFSKTSSVKSGVPQGSVLGPALFLIFVADVADIIQNFISLYADDSKLFSYILDSHDNQHTQVSIQEDINTLCHWSDRMQMSFNVDKCHRLHMGNSNTQYQYSLPKISSLKKTNSSISYTYTFHPLKKVTSEKDLGVTVDDRLDFKLHISQKIAKANSMIYLIKHYFKYLDADMLKLLYKSLIRPHLEYCSPVWSPITKTEIRRIEGVQRRATKLVPELTNLPYSDRLHILQLPTLEYRRTRQDLIFIFNYIHQNILLDPHTYCKLCRNDINMLTPITSGTRGHPYRFAILRHPTKRNRFLTTRAIPLWNRLHPDTVTAPTLNAFKSKLKKDHSMPDPHTFQSDVRTNISGRAT